MIGKFQQEYDLDATCVCEEEFNQAMQQTLLRVALLLEDPPGRLSDEDEGGHEEDPPDPIGDLQNRS